MADDKLRSRTAWLLFGIMAFLSSIFAIQGALLTRVIEEFHPDSYGQGLIASLCSVGGCVAYISALFLIGRIRKTVLLWIGILIGAVSLALLTVVPGYGLFTAVWLLIGLGLGYMDALLSSCMADLYSGPKGIRMMCNLHTVYGVFSMGTPLLFSAMLENGVNYRLIYLVPAAWGLLMFVLLGAVNRTSAGEGTDAVRVEEPMSFSRMLKVLKNGSLPIFAIAAVCHGFFLGGLNNWITHYVGVTLADSLGGVALTFMYLGVLVSRFCMPYTGIPADWFIRLAGFGAGALLLIGIPFGNGLIMCIATALSGLLFGAMIPCMMNVACENTPESSLLATSLLMLMLYIGEGVSSPVLGKLEATVGLKWGMVLCAAFMVMTSAVLCVGLRKKNIQNES